MSDSGQKSNMTSESCKGCLVTNCMVNCDTTGYTGGVYTLIGNPRTSEGRDPVPGVRRSGLQGVHGAEQDTRRAAGVPVL